MRRLRQISVLVCLALAAPVMAETEADELDALTNQYQVMKRESLQVKSAIDKARERITSKLDDVRAIEGCDMGTYEQELYAEEITKSAMVNAYMTKSQMHYYGDPKSVVLSAYAETEPQGEIAKRVAIQQQLVAKSADDLRLVTSQLNSIGCSVSEINTNSNKEDYRMLASYLSVLVDNEALYDIQALKLRRLELRINWLRAGVLPDEEQEALYN